MSRSKQYTAPNLNQSQSSGVASSLQWEEIASGADFRLLLSSKTRFIVGATAFFLAYYFALPVLSGYWPDLMKTKVIGHFSLAYVFALSQFPMAWLVAALYVRAASRFDREAAAILARHAGPGATPLTKANS